MENVQKIVGADLSKKSIDLAIHATQEHLRIDNNREGFKKMVHWLKYQKIDPSRLTIVMEHTGLYSYCFEAFLHEKGYRFNKVNPLDIKYSIGLTRGKSDKMDAARIAAFGFEKQGRLKAETPLSQALQALKLLNTSREKLVSTRAGLKASIEEFRNIGLKDSSMALHCQLQVVAQLDKQIEKLDKEIKEVIHQEEKIAKNYALLNSIKGVGPVVATNTIIKTHNFERFANARKFACYCGIAPFENSSGTSVRRRTRVNHMADKGMKTILDLAAKSAIGCDKELKEFYQKRVEQGKSKMSTINIIRNKIVGRMFAVVNRQTPYEQNFLKTSWN